MLKWKEVLIGVLALSVIGSAILLSAEHKAAKNYIAAAEDLKEQNRRVEEKLRKVEADFSQLENEKRQLRTDIVDLREPDEDGSQEIIRKLKSDLAQKEGEHNALKEEYNSALEAFNELLRGETAASEQRRQERRQRFTPEQREQAMASWRERSSEMMDGRIEAAATDYEAELLEEMKQRNASMFALMDELRSATDEEREALRDEMADERRAMSELNDEYNSYQWKSLGEKFGVKDVEEFVKQVQELSQRRRYRFGGPRRPRER